MEYEVIQDRLYSDQWRVEAIDHEGEGEVYITIFSGPDARHRAQEYAAWKSLGSAKAWIALPVKLSRRG